VTGHALTLNLLGTYLAQAHRGDVRKRDQVDLQEADNEVQGGHAFKAIAAYEKWLEQGGEKGARQLTILRLLGLFDRPADAGCITALRRPPVIAGLTEPLVGLHAKDWNLALSALREARLVAGPPPPIGPGGTSTEWEDLDAHPLLREHFARRLREQHPEAWRAAHSRLYEHLRDTTESLPDALEGLQPLYQAVTHGCQAGRYEEARAEVYRDRISRDAEAYVVKKLGAFGADLGAVASFFERPWSRVSPALTKAAQAWLLNQAAFRLRALGRLTEALEPLRITLEINIQAQAWANAASVASNLSELELTLGKVAAAVCTAEQAVTFADRNGEWSLRMMLRTAQADALHQAGRRAEALELFREAERMQTEQQPEYPLLYSLQGFQYCDLLLAGTEGVAWRDEGKGTDLSALASEARQVEERAGKTLIWLTKAGSGLLSIALNHLSLGRSRLYPAVLEKADLTSASSEVSEAVKGLRRAGSMDHIPLGLLTRAWLRALQGDSSGARADLDEAQEIAERGPMPLYLADIALYRARLFRDRAALATARELIEKHGYGRRLEELADTEAAARGW
jgi:tetratricopeptide (TPR) repeat protein